MIQPGASLIRMLISLGVLGTLAAICYVLLLPYQGYRRVRAARRERATHAKRSAARARLAVGLPARLVTSD